jgi:hypothetical protein
MHRCGASRDATDYRFGPLGGSKYAPLKRMLTWRHGARPDDSGHRSCRRGRAMPFNKAEPRRVRPEPPSAAPSQPPAAPPPRPRRFVTGAAETADRLGAHGVVAVVCLAIGFLVPAVGAMGRPIDGLPALTASEPEPTSAARETAPVSTTTPAPTATRTSAATPTATATATATAAPVVAAPPPPPPPPPPAAPPAVAASTPEPLETPVPTAVPSEVPTPTPTPTPPLEVCTPDLEPLPSACVGVSPAPEPTSSP